MPYTEGEGGEDLKVEIKIDPARAEPAVTVTAPALTEEVRALVRSLEPRGLTGWRGEEAIPLEPGDLLRCYAANKGVYAQSPAGESLVKLRLYELEERLDPGVFVRISHSEIVNLKQVTALDLSLAGTIKMTLAGGAAVCWVSRRYVPKIKQALGLGRGRRA